MFDVWELMAAKLKNATNLSCHSCILIIKNTIYYEIQNLIKKIQREKKKYYTYIYSIFKIDFLIFVSKILFVAHFYTPSYFL